MLCKLLTLLLMLCKLLTLLSMLCKLLTLLWLLILFVMICFLLPTLDCGNKPAVAFGEVRRRRRAESGFPVRRTTPCGTCEQRSVPSLHMSIYTGREYMWPYTKNIYIRLYCSFRRFW